MKNRKSGQTLAQLVYQQLRDKMLRGDLKFGTPLSRRALASELGMSLIPVSEAMQRLEMDGLVESWPRVGTRVTVPTVEDIRDFVILREALEAQAARLSRNWQVQRSAKNWSEWGRSWIFCSGAR